ncbi:hypothetical protein FJ417_25705, partial [Mesorhizobium sp. B3-1-7]
MGEKDGDGGGVEAVEEESGHGIVPGATAKLLISPLVGEMAGRTEGGAVPPASQPLAAAGSGVVFM